MCSINFVREFGLMMEEARKEYLGCRERMLWIALFYIANDRAKYNPQTQTYDWPTGFFQISHQELDLYCKLNKKAVLELRNHLKQKGYIDFAKGERNAEKPMYKLNYLSLREFGSENDPKEGANISPKDTPKEGANISPNTDAKEAPFLYKYKQGVSMGIRSGYTHTDDKEDYPYTRTRKEGYIDAKGIERPARFDAAWITSARARAAVAQRLIDGFSFSCDGDSFLHNHLMDMMAYGMPPELIEDLGEQCATPERLKTLLSIIAQQRGYTEEAREWDRCLKVANGNAEFAERLYKMHLRNQNAQEA